MVKIKKAKHLPKERSQKMKVKVKLNLKYLECLGYGHLRNECSDFKRNKGKALMLH